MTALARLRRLAAIAGAAIVVAGHVGSPNVFFDGKAGPYDVRIIVRPPDVVPGIADVIVRAADPAVQRVIVRPVYWRVGERGAPEGDVARPVRGEPGTWTGQLWLMSRGSNSVYVTIEGTAGNGTAIVPVFAAATGRLGLSTPLAGILIVLGLLLVAGLVSIVYAAAGESVTDPGVEPSPRAKRRARLAAVLALPVIGLVLLGGARWWSAVDDDYQRTMFVPPAALATITAEGSRTVLELALRDTGRTRTLGVPAMPDHGKMMHMLLVDSTMTSVAHLHPVPTDSFTFRTAMPPLPAGRYRLFADVLLETGAQLTATRSIDVGDIATGGTTDDPDDAWATALVPVTAAAGAAVSLSDGFRLEWGGEPSPVRVGDAVDLRFTVRDSGGAVAAVEPYLGMSGHAFVVARDGSVYVHLHPMGTVPPAAQDAFAARDRGDTTERGRLRPASLNTHGAHGAPMEGRLSFPYEFPRAGSYRIFVQLRRGGATHTAAFDIDAR